MVPPIDASEIPWVILASTSTPERRRNKNPERPARLHHRSRAGSVRPRRVQAPRGGEGAGGGLGAAAAGALAPGRGMLRVALRVELDRGGRAARRAVPVLALLRRPVLQPELRVQHVGHRHLASLTWLDAQPAGSVVYVAFGSSGFLDATQFQELADGLALSGRPFLWVVRPKFTTGPGQDRFDLDARGVVPKEEVQSKGARLLGDGEVKARVATWKEIACGSIRVGGSSHRNLLKLVSLLRQQ
ncbi:unnamed protein product [Triticum turgidum subsp. durum]|uniref:Glycosyltransferase n=1 Tax=Triticum turgidum subsp. durum TaxID=4567 RepID=A0A9R0WS90_TRITD|nr:unnamed protein product [Triticum turgidum subsp. durum]